MIVLRDLTKVYWANGRRKVVADGINLTVPTGMSLGVLGRNGAGKTTLLRMVAGLVTPTSGEVLTDGSISFPVGIASATHPDLTGAQNTRFVARLYGVDTDELLDFVEDFAELGDHFHMPVRSYSSGMRARLGFGINMGLKFDMYLIDEATATGDGAFVRKAQAVFRERMRNAGALFISHSIGQVRELCEAVAVLDKGRLTYFDDVDAGIAHYEEQLRAG